MQLITTMSQKGQVVVPKKIRDDIGLNVLDKLLVSIQDGRIIMSPVSKSDEVFGMFKTKKIITKLDIKNAKKQAMLKKFS